jgi:Tfp pilus assembly protein PilF
MSSGPKPTAEKKLRETLKTDPAEWETRKQLAHLLYDQENFVEAADLI